MKDFDEYQRAEDRRSIRESFRTMRWWEWAICGTIAAWAAITLIVAYNSYEPPPPPTFEEQRAHKCAAALSELADLEYEHRHGRLKPSDYRRRLGAAADDRSRYC